MPPPSTPTAADVAAQLDAVRRRVLNVVGHELRTPVTTVRGLAESLLVAADEEVRSEIAPALVRNARRLERLLDDLLLAAGVTTALPVDPPAAVAVGDAALAAWAELEERSELVVDGDAGATASFPPPALRRVLAHVLDNARKYGRPPVRCTVRAGGDRVLVEVEAPGASITEHDCEAAFEPFYRGEAAVITAPGLGVGLPVARALVTAGGGSISLAPTPGGVTAFLDLPAGEA